MNEALFLIDSQSNIQFSSTFTPGSFQLTNNSDSQDIVSITLDISNALFPDLVFDPTGAAGDTTAKGFEFDSQNDEGNTVAIANYPFNDPTTPFSGFRNGGYDVLTIDFTSFQPGQTLKFSADIDPTSIQGADDPGPSDSGSISGLELVGATITVKFADNTELTGQVYRRPGSEVASEVTLSGTPQAAPEIEAVGFAGAATVNDANQTIRVTGNPGSEVSLLVVEGGFYTGGGGVDPDPDAFEANRAIAVNEITATVGADGFVDVPVNLTYTEIDGSGGLNYIVAKYQGNSSISDRVVLEYDPDSTPNPGVNPGTGTVLPDGTIRVEAENYKANAVGEENYFDFTPENQGGAYRPNEPVDIEVTGDTGGGFNVAFIQSGEFLTYDVNVPTAGTYNILLRVASPSADTQSAEITINGQNYPVDFAPTGDWQVYQDVLVSNVSLAAGTQQLRFDARSSEFNFNYIDLTPAEPGVDGVAPTAVLNTTSAATIVGTANAPTFTVAYSDNVALDPTTIDAGDLTVTAPDGTEMVVTLAGVDGGTATYAIAAPGGTWDLAEAGDYTIALKAGEISDTAGNTAVAANLGTVNIYFESDEPQPPVGDGVIRLEAEDYKANAAGEENYFDFTPENEGGKYRLNEPVDIEETGDTNGGFNVAFIQSGEYLTYDANVAEAGSYDVVLRVASPATTTQSAEITINGQNYPIDFAPTGDWQAFQDVLVANVELAAGVQEVRFDARSSEFNLNYIDLVAAEPGEPVVDTTAPTAILNTTSAATVVGTATAPTFTVTYSDDTALDATTIDGDELTVTAADGTAMVVTLVGVEAGTATYAIAAPGGTWELAEAGDYTIALNAGSVSDAVGNTSVAADLGSLNIFFEDQEPQPPVTGGVIRLEAEDYKANAVGEENYFDFTPENQGGEYRLNEPVDIEKTGDTGGGFNVAFIQSGEYLTYDANVAEAGSYDVVLRVASPATTTQSAEITINGQNYPISFEPTGDWQVYQDVVVANVELAAGVQEVRFDARSSEFNLNYIDLVADQPVDITAPTAVLDTVNVSTTIDGTAALNFAVTYSDDTAIDATTIDDTDLTVTAADGTELTVSLVGVDGGTATYAIAAPGGAWEQSASGDYAVSINAGEISDTAGNTMAATDLGSLNINIQNNEPVDTTAPTAILDTANISTAVNDTAAVTFTVTYSDDTALDATTIDAEDLTVTAPDGTELGVTLASVDGGTATYAIAAPGGAWDLAEAGDYTVSLNADVVSDAAGNANAAATLGTVNLTVTNDGVVVPPSGSAIRIEAEDYNAGMNGIAYLDTSNGNFGGAYRTDHVDLETTGDTGGGFNVSSIQAGEFLTYNVDVAEPGTYEVVLRVATPAEAQSLDLTLGGQTVSANFGATGGWQAYQDVVVADLNLGAGSQELRLDMKSSSFNLNYVELRPKTVIDPGDTTAPTVNLDTTVLSLSADSGATANFSVTYSDASGIDAATIDANDLTVTAPDGTELGVTLAGVDGGTATYAIAAPDGTWDLAESGDYSISLKAGEVSDTLGNAVAAAALGNLSISVEAGDTGDTTPPTAVLNTANLSTPANGTAALNFTIAYSDDTAVDASTIDANDLTVTAPDGTELAVSLVGVDAGTATYAIAAPGGTWATADAGEYNISAKAGEVTDTNGNALDAGALGTLTVNVTDEPPAESIRIEAEDYKAGTNGTEYFDFDDDINRGGAYRPDEGVDVEVTGDVEGNFNVGFIQSGEFLTYDVNVPTAGEYNIVLRVAANEDAQSLEVVAGEDTYTANFDFTGSFQTYIDVVIPNVSLAAGEQELRLNARSSAFNINYFDIVPAGDFVDVTAPTATLSTTNLTQQADSNIPANFTVNLNDNIGVDFTSIDSNDVTVTAPDGTVLETTLTEANGNGTNISATYFFDAPGGTWDAADAGNYTVNLNAGEIADNSGNLSAAANLGNLTINVPTVVDDGAIRINAGATANQVDSNGRLWLADANFVGGQASTVGDAIDNTENINTADAFVYQAQRSAADGFSYNIPVEDGNYKVNLHLAELDFDNAGFREFDVSLEGDLVLDNYDIWANTKNAQRDGGDTAKVQEISDLLIVRDGAINLDFASVANNATLAGIEILPIQGAQALILESGNGTLVTEGGNSDTYQVLLNTQPTADVTINLQPDGQTTVDQNALTFTPENWNVPQTVTVNAVDDNVSESFSIPATISHTISTADPTYSNVNIPNLNLQVIDNDAADAEIRFEQKVLDINLSEKTTAAWGPDGRLYVGSLGGTIEAYTLDDNYNIIDTQVISTLQNLPNHEILGIAFNPFENDGGTPKLYVSHSQLYANEYTYEREGGTGFNELVDFSPYSGEVSVLSGADFSQREIIVDNLGVSNHDHGVNGLAFDDNGDLLVSVGGNTNAGIPDDDIGGLDESPFTAAIIKAEITKPGYNGNIQYQLPADWVAPEGLQIENPVASQGFGGIVDVAPGVDVSVYASGLRNSYDLVYSTKGILYATENDANSGFGDYSTSATTQEPFNLDPQNEINIVEEGNYYGNPNRNRGRQDDRQNVYRPSFDSSDEGYTAPIRQHPQHIHGITEYRSTTFSEQLRGDLLTIELDSNGGTVINVELTDDGRGVENLVGLKTEPSGGENLSQGLDVVTGFGGSIVGVNYFGNVTAAIPVNDSITTATAYEIDEWRAPASGGGRFTIGGVNFSELADTTVTIGNEVASLISVSDKRIFGTLPAFDAGEYAGQGLLDITVNSGGELSVITDAFQPLFI